MTQAFVIFGRQPKLGLAELESLYGAGSIEPIGHVAALLNIEPSEVNFARLGGTVKFGKLLTILETTSWKDIEEFLIKAVPEHATTLELGKLRLGISAYELHVGPKDIMVTGLKIKKALKSAGRSSRLIPNTMPILNSAQVLHNNLTSRMGWELLLVRHGDKTYVGQSIAVQDIEAYGARDHGRPMRDAKVGMLPPKLAQIIINLAVGKLVDSRSHIVDSKTPIQSTTYNLLPTILDPFCGTGVILQESLLMGMQAYGSDLEPRMVEYTRANLDWFTQTSYYNQVCGVEKKPKTSIKLEVADATNHQWSLFDAIACETYLGRAFSAPPKPDVLEKVIQDVNTIHKKFLSNVAQQTKTGFKMCIAVPAWKIENRNEKREMRMESSGLRTQDSGLFKHLPVLDSLQELGYTRAVFKCANNEELIYHREGQIVGRELVLLTRI